MEEKVLGFDEKLNALLAEARKKKNVLEDSEIQAYFSQFPMDPDAWDKVYDFLDANKVDVLRLGDAEDLRCFMNSLWRCLRR